MEEILYFFFGAFLYSCCGFFNQLKSFMEILEKSNNKELQQSILEGQMHGLAF